ncbi:MAG: cytochrome P450 [Acidobacteria bacterium]|nr:cytochrome P450 [Acidobacteriota bacterium]MCA1618409.1 cytochrome P450 [Acidobacteriota bacterium]
MDAETLDLSAPEVVSDPFPHYENLRLRGAVHFLPRHGFWLVVGFDEVHAALMRPEVFSNRVADYTQVDDVLLGADPPAHTAARRVVAPLFSTQALEAEAAFAESAAERLLQPLLAGREFDVLRDYASPLVEEVIAHLVGLDEGLLATIRAPRLAGASIEQQLAAIDSSVVTVAAGLPVCKRLLSTGLEHTQALSLFRLLWVAGTTTTRRAIASSVLLLLKNPDARRRVTSDPSLVPAFVEEAIRLHPPEHLLSRVAAVESELAGVKIPAGGAVKLCVASANRDPARFEHPDALILERTPNRQLSFGGGIHRCVGASLARLEAAAALRALLRLAPDFRAARPLDALGFVGFANDTERLEIQT